MGEQLIGISLIQILRGTKSAAEHFEILSSYVDDAGFCASF